MGSITLVLSMLRHQTLALAILLLLSLLVQDTRASRVPRARVPRARVPRAAEVAELPAGFKCDLCSKCKESCNFQCVKCSGCDLLKAFHVDPEQLKAVGVNPEECTTFCNGGVAGCTKICEEAKNDCHYCQFCELYCTALYYP